MDAEKKAYWNRWYALNKDKVKASRSRSKDKRQEYAQKYGELNKERLREYRKKYWEEHKEERKAYGQEYYQRNKVRLLQKAKKYQEQWYDALKTEVLSHYSTGGILACVICGEKRLSCLSIDHINNDGAEHRRRLGTGGKNFYKWLKEQNFPEGYQTLCMNDQFIKEFRRRRGYG